MYLGLWHLTETEDYFLENLDLSQEETDQLEIIKGDRRRHWLCARLLLHHLSAREERILPIKDVYGKPFLQGSDHHISLSHSDELVAVIAGLPCVGIDIQKRVPKITRIKHKFCTESEERLLQELDPLAMWHLLWGAKESAFKAYGRKRVDYLKDLAMTEFADDRFTMVLNKTDELHEYTGRLEQWQDYTLVYLWEITKT